MSRLGGTPQKISHAASQLLFDQLTQLDRQIDKHVSEANAAMSTISRAVASAQSVYEKRCALANELNHIAPDDFTGVQSGGAMMAGAPYARFQRLHPFPTAYAMPVPAAPVAPWGGDDDPR